MRIIHVVTSLDPADGGPPVVAARLAAAQGALGHDVSILSGDLPNARFDALWSGVPGGEHVGVGCGADVVAADVLHLHGVWGGLLRRTAAAAVQNRVPHVVSPHGMLDPWSLAQKRLKKRVALLLGYRRMLDGAAFLHALNGDEAQLWSPLRLRPPAVVVPNGIFPAEVDPLPPAGTFRAAHPALGGDPYVLFLGRLHPKKGLDVLADALAILRHPTCRLVVAGPDGGARSDFVRRLAAHGLAGRVQFVGPLYGAAKYAALVDAAAFCLPSRQEGFSVAILEAMACGVPVVISAACHFPEVATASAGLIVDLSAAAVAAGLDRALSAPGDMGRSGRELVMSRYTWPRVAEAMVAAYQVHATR